MADLPHPWDTYARLQACLDRDPHLTDRSWGLEEALNHIVELPSASVEEIARVCASARRRERFRKTRRVPMSEHIGTADPLPNLIARQELLVIRAHVRDDEWNLLTDTAAGTPQREMASIRRLSSGALRVRLTRMRRKIATLLAA